MKRTSSLVFILSCITLLFFFGDLLFLGAENIYAQSSNQRSDIGDCSVFGKSNDPKISFAGAFDLGDIYPQNNQEIALENLKKYCCNMYQKNSSGRNCVSNTDKNYANSNRIYDHIVDIGFRSLDGDASLAYPGQILDPVGQSWHKLLYGDEENTGYATDPFGAIPLQLWTDFGRFWGLDPDGSVQYSLNESFAPEDNILQYKKYRDNRNIFPPEQDALGLISRYLAICHVAQDIVIDNNPGTYVFDDCKKVALERIYDENIYIQHVLIEQGLTALNKNFENYAQGVFVQQNLSRLLEKIIEMNSGLQYINNRVTEVTRMCSG